MARFTNNSIGPFVGKLGVVIGSSWKGIPYMKTLNERKKPATENEKSNRQKFAQAQKWLKPLLDFVRQGFKGYSPTVEGFVAAKSHLLKNAMEKTDDGFVVNPALVKLSFGDLPMPDNIRMQKLENNELQFSWDESNNDHAYDQAMLLAYDIERGHVNMKLTGQFRYVGSDTLRIWKARTLHIYIAFIAADRSRQSESLYLGEVK